MNRKEALARLEGAEWLARARPFFACLDGAQGRTRAVGGIVRDTLLGLSRSGTDIDLATELLPEEVMARGEAAGLGVHPTGVEHGTVTLVSSGVTAEVTTLREDVETFGRRARVQFGTDWARDAARRDFTMNALYAGADGALFDPLGGVEDCLARRVRFIGDAEARIAEDRLRVYRYFRFAASHGGQVFEPEALAACAREAGTLDSLSAERVGAEMMRLLGLPRIALTVREMVAAGVLGRDIVPEGTLEAFGRLEALTKAARAPVRLAMLHLGGADLDMLQARWRLANAVCAEAVAIGSAAEMARDGDWLSLAYYHPERGEDGICVAAALEGYGEEWWSDARARIASLKPGRFPLRGGDLSQVGFKPGPELGRELRRLERLWIESEYRLDKQALLKSARLPE